MGSCAPTREGEPREGEVPVWAPPVSCRPRNAGHVSFTVGNISCQEHEDALLLATGGSMGSASSLSYIPGTDAWARAGCSFPIAQSLGGSQGSPDPPLPTSQPVPASLGGLAFLCFCDLSGLSVVGPKGVCSVLGREFCWTASCQPACWCLADSFLHVTILWAPTSLSCSNYTYLLHLAFGIWCNLFPFTR